jgi:hypothetical protein
MSEGSVVHFAKYLNDLDVATNESQKRHLFTSLAAVGFRGTDFATELALGAEYRVHFQQAGLVRRGAVDSFFGNLVIEFEHDLGRTLDHALDQLRGYVAGAWREEGGADRPYLAVATDGAVWRVFVPTLKQPEEDIEAENIELTPSESWSPAGADDPISLRDFLNRLFFRNRLLRPTATNFAKDFGLTSPAFLGAAGGLWQKLGELAEDPQLEVVRSAWSESLQIAYGSIDAKDDLFVKHTYLAVLARLLVWAALERRHMEQADLQDVLSGKYFAAKHVENMAEDDYFRWYEIPSETQASRVWIALSRHLAGYDLTEISEDVLKPLYEQLVDPETRRDLGEFYTPDWLATIVTDHLFEGWDWESGVPAVLDATCGSGTFLRAAIDGIRRRRQGLAAAELLRTVLAGVAGMDIHPLAVIVAKATYLLAIKDLVPAASRPITLPVFLSNSLLIPRVERTASLWGDRVPLFIDGTKYEVPPEFLTHGRDFDEAIGAVVEVAHAYGTTKSPLRDVHASLRAVIGDRLDKYPQATEVVEVLASMAAHIARLIRGRRDSVHGFMLRNHYRPAMLRHAFDLVVGNPPWLTVSDVGTPDYKNLVVRLAVEANIAPRGAREQAHTELATIFLWHVATQFLKLRQSDDPTPRVALVMPRSVMTATHHALLREAKYRGRFDLKELWDLDGVTPLFNVPACVVFASPSAPRPTVPKVGRVYSGRLPQKDLPWTKAAERLEWEDASFELVYLGKRSAWRPVSSAGVGTSSADTVSANAYRDNFRQGAIIYPNTLFVVLPEGAAKRGAGPIRVRTDPEAAKKALLLRDARVNEVVEAENLYTTAAAHHLLPYALAPRLWTVILPTLRDPGDKDFAAVDADDLRKAGRVGTASWLDWAEDRWASVRKADDDTPLHRRLDHLKQFSAQAHMRRHVVLYTAQGNRPVACYLDRHQHDLPFVARDQTYWTSFGEPEPALFLVAFLNSEFVVNAIRDWMTRGLFGPRHIHKRVLDVPWPAFQPENDRHVALVETARGLRDAAVNLATDLPKMSGGRQRTWLRDHLDVGGVAKVEQLVGAISSGGD